DKAARRGHAPPVGRRQRPRRGDVAGGEAIVTPRGAPGRMGAALVPLALASVAFASSAEPECGTEAVRTGAGAVCGLRLDVDGAEVNAFLGIPYGEDTAGENR